MKTLLFLLLSSSAFATVTLTNALGTSKFVKETDGSVTLYGGIQGGNVVPATYGCDVNNTCNTCRGNPASNPAQQVACNITGVFKETVVTFIGTQTTNLANGRFVLCNGNTEIDRTNNLSENLQTTWGEICDGIDGSDSSCSTNVNQTLTFGVGTGCTDIGNEKVNVKVTTRIVDIEPNNAATNNTYIPPALPVLPNTEPIPDDCTAATGVCFFRVFPGDGKIFLDRELGVGLAASFPQISNTIVHDKIVLFFRETGTAIDDESQDFETFSAITTADDYGLISVASNGEVSGESIDGLTNDTRYCFKIGSQDTAGNIDQISSTDCSIAGEGDINNATSDCRNVCTVPSEVFGLLSDTNCFIATAAYGSPLDPHVNRLREFKNQFLVPHPWGKKFVKAYYSISPPIAKFISENEILRSIVRLFLWPVVFAVELILQFGFMVLLTPLILMSFYLVIKKSWAIAK